MYIYTLPHIERMELCRMLDQDDKWEELGVLMKYDMMTLGAIRREKLRGNSPTDELLTLWGQLNHTVVELFFLLSDLKHYQALLSLKPFVDSKYHCIINEGANLNHLFDKLKLKPLNKPDVNLNKDVNVNNMLPASKSEIERKCVVMDKELNVEKCDPEYFVTRDDNITKKQETSNVKNGTQLSAYISSTGEPVSSIPHIAYEELKAATYNWDPSTILGKGGFGTVYKGIWKCTKVAVKRIETRKADTVESQRIQMEQSLRELHCLNMYRHDNVLPLYGYSIGGIHPCLIYQYMAGGNLEQRLHARKVERLLNWAQRLNVAKGVARGLQFLHTIGDKPLIHSDIKSANILLDPSNEPKIGDFGLAREGPVSAFTHIEVSRVHGTRPYLPDEFLRAKKMSTKVDTFSFGVVLFEIGTGLSAYSEAREHKFLKDHVTDYVGNILDLKDKHCPGDETVFLDLIDIGKECVSKKAKDRPEMRTVLLKIEEIPIPV